MDKKQDSSRELFNEVKEMMDANKLIDLREMLDEYHTMDIYDILLELDNNDQVKLFEILPLDTAADILEECEADFFIKIVSQIDKEHAKSVLNEMSLGDLSDILREMDEDEREKILDIVSKEDEIELRELLAYVDETSGSTMKKGYITVNKNLNVSQAIRHIRAVSVEADSIYYIYVVDNEQKLVGVLSLRDLFISKDSSTMEDIMVENVKSVKDNEDREEAVKLVSKYNLVAIPVVDDEGVLKGIITVDDILDVMEEEASEDMYKFAGSSEHERDVAENENSTLFEQVISCVRGRLGWLVVTLILSFVTAYIFMKFQGLMSTKMSELIFFVPMILTIGGNVATQSSAVTVINLIDKDKEVDFQTIAKELVSAAINGLVLVVIAIIVLLLLGGAKMSMVIIAVSILINVLLGAAFGTLMPIVINKFEADPSVVTSPVITVIMDVIGVLVYFLIISAFVGL